MLNSHAVKAIKNRRSIIFHDTMYAKDASIAEAKEILMKKFGYTEQAIKNLAKDSDPRGYKVKDQIIKGFMIYKSGKPNAFTAKNESGEQYEGTMEEIKAKIDAYWVKRDEDVMKQKDGLTSEDKRQIQESIRRLESKRKEAIKAGKENYLNSEIARLKKALEEPTDFFMRDISDSKTKDKSPRWRIKDDKMFKLKTAAKKMKDSAIERIQELSDSNIINLIRQFQKAKISTNQSKEFRELLAEASRRGLNTWKIGDAKTKGSAGLELKMGLRRGALQNEFDGTKNNVEVKLKTKDKYGDKIAYKGYLIGEYLNGKFWIEKDGFVIRHEAPSIEDAKKDINMLTADAKTKDGHKRMTLVELRKKAKEGYFELQSDPKPRNHIEVKYPSGKKEWIFVEDADLLNEQDKRLINEQLERIKKHCPINSKWYIYKSGKLAVAVTVIGYPKDLNGYGEDRVITNKGVFSIQKLIDPSFMLSFKERGGKVEDSDSQREILAKLAEKAGDIEYANDVRSGKVPYGQLAKRIAYYGLYSTGDAKNYMGERSFRTYEAWKRACKEINPSVVFEGNRDICQAKPGIGEWDGNEGIIYTKDGIAKYSKTKDNQQLVQIYKGVEIIFDDVQGVYWCKRKGATLALKDNDIGRLKKSLDFYLEGKGYDSKSTKDSVNGVINSIKNNPTIKKLLNPGKSNVYKNDNLYGVTPYGYLVRFSGGYLVFGPSGEYVKSLSSSMIQGELGTLVGEVSTFDSKTNDDVMYQGQSYPVKELHRILANKGKVKEFNELSEKEQKERMGNPFALYESGDNIYAVVRRNKVN